MKSIQEITEKRNNLLAFVEGVVEDDSIILSSQQKARIQSKLNILNWVLDEDDGEERKKLLTRRMPMNDVTGRIAEREKIVYRLLNVKSRKIKELADLTGYPLNQIKITIRQLKKENLIYPTKDGIYRIWSVVKQ